MGGKRKRRRTSGRCWRSNEEVGRDARRRREQWNRICRGARSVFGSGRKRRRFALSQGKQDVPNSEDLVEVLDMLIDGSVGRKTLRLLLISQLPTLYEKNEESQRSLPLTSSRRDSLRYDPNSGGDSARPDPVCALVGKRTEGIRPSRAGMARPAGVDARSSLAGLLPLELGVAFERCEGLERRNHDAGDGTRDEAGGGAG
jgi:hypothetical protein